MSRYLSRVLRESLSPSSPYGQVLVHYCQACREEHVLYVGPGKWSWNGDAENPTITPSFRHYHPAHKDRDTGEDVPEKTICHYFITGGMIDYCPDSPHGWVGKHPMGPAPWWTGEQDD